MINQNKVGKVRKSLLIKKGKLEIGQYQEKKSEDLTYKKRFLESLNLATELGFVIAIPIVGGAILGSYLDRKLNTEPKITLSLIFLGLTISLYNIYKISKRNL